MIKIFKISAFSFFLFALVSCQNESCDESPDISDIEIESELIRMDAEMKTLKTKAQILEFVNRYPSVKYGFLQIGQYPDSMVVDYLYNVVNISATDTIYKEMNEAFGDFSKLKDEFDNAFKLLKYYFNDNKDRDIFIFMSGLSRDLYIDDSCVVVGADFFIGEKATFKPQGYNYMLKRYGTATILPMSMVYLSTKYNAYDKTDESLLAEMIYYGKAYYFTEKILPCVADSIIIGYSAEEWDGSEKHIARIWTYFLENELLFEKRHSIKKKYVDERPNTLEIGNKCPGRIGQWLGWLIVKKYMENNPDVTLKQLMENKNAKEIFDNSKFKPLR